MTGKKNKRGKRGSTEEETNAAKRPNKEQTVYVRNNRETHYLADMSSIACKYLRSSISLPIKLILSL